MSPHEEHDPWFEERPIPPSARDVVRRRFRMVARGFDPDEVLDYLTELASTLHAVEQRAAILDQRRTELEEFENQLEAKAAAIRATCEQVVARAAQAAAEDTKRGAA